MEYLLFLLPLPIALGGMITGKSIAIYLEKRNNHKVIINE